MADTDDENEGTQDKKNEDVTSKAEEKEKDSEMKTEKKERKSHFSSNERTIMVRDLSDDTALEDVEEYFRDNSKSAGGEIEELKYIDEEDGYQITFKEIATAERVLKKQNHVLDDSSLKISDMTEFDTPTMLEITLKEHIPEQTVLEYFKNRRKSGGGKIAYMQTEENSNVFRIFFEDQNACGRVLEGEHKRYTVASVRMKLDLWRNIRMVRKQSEVQVGEAAMILVSKLNPITNQFTICKYFENHRRSSGGAVSRIWILLAHNAVLVEFKNKDVAEAVMKHIGHKIDGYNLEIIPFNDPVESFPGKPCKYFRETLTDVSIQVSWDEAATITKDAVELLFINENRSGGGPMKSYVFDTEAHCAYITFEDVQYAYTTYQKGKVEEFSLDGAQLKVSLLEGEVFTESNAIAVANLTNEFEDSSIIYHFESLHNSGGPIEMYHRDCARGMAFITYENKKVTRAVGQKEHHINKVKLQVQMLVPSPLCGLVEGAMAPTKCRLRYLPLVHEMKELEEFLKMTIDVGITSMFYSSIPGSAVIEFSHELNSEEYQNIRHLVNTAPFKGNMCQIGRIEVTNCVQISWLGEEKVKINDIKSFFNHSQYSVATIRCVQVEEEYAVVEFADDIVFNRGILQENPYIRGVSCKVQRYYPVLGVQPYDHNTSKPPVFVPDSTIVEADVEILRFFFHSATHKHPLENQIKQLYGKINWPPNPCSTVKIACTLDKTNPTAAQLGATWKTDIHDHWNHIIKQFVHGTVKPVDEIFERLMTKTNELMNSAGDNCRVSRFAKQC